MQARSRALVIAALTALPAAAGAFGLTGVAILRLVAPEADLFGPPPPASFADALTSRRPVDDTYPFIHRGASPNEPLAIADADLTAGVQVAAAPLMIATATGEPNVVSMLLTFGARLDLPQNRHAPCLARELGLREILETFAAEAASAPAAACPPRRDAPTPLLRWLPGPDRAEPLGVEAGW